MSAVSMLVYWNEERAWSVQSISTIVEPKKKYGEVYKVAEKISARFHGSPYPGTIIEISDDRSILKETGLKLEKILKESECLDTDQIIKRLKNIDTCTSEDQSLRNTPNNDKIAKVKCNKARTVNKCTGIKEVAMQAEASSLLERPRTSIFSHIQKNTDADIQEINNYSDSDDDANRLVILESYSLQQKKNDHAVKGNESLQSARVSNALVGSETILEDKSTSPKAKKRHLSADNGLSVKRPNQENTCSSTNTANSGSSCELSPQIDAKALGSEDEMFEWIKSNLNKLDQTYRKRLVILEEKVEDQETKLRKQKASIKSLQKEIQEMKTRNQEEQPQEENFYDGKNAAQILEIIKHNENFQGCVKHVFVTVFGEKYIVDHSIYGKRANHSVELKPSFDTRTLEFLFKILQNKFPDKSRSDIKMKVENLQKVLRHKYKSG